MSEETISVIIAKLEGLKEIMNERFDRNEEHHRQVNEHLAKLNGQTAKNSAFRIQQATVNAILGVICTGLLFPAILNLFSK